jgi:hypothetical protein
VARHQSSTPNEYTSTNWDISAPWALSGAIKAGVPTCGSLDTPPHARTKSLFLPGAVGEKKITSYTCDVVWIFGPPNPLNISIVLIPMARPRAHAPVLSSDYRC